MTNAKPILMSLALLISFVDAKAETCGQLAAVKGPDVEILRLQSGRATDMVRFAILVAENKVAPIECDDVIVCGHDSSAKVILGETKLALAPESRVAIAEHTGASTGKGSAPKVSILDLTYGKVRALVNRKNGVIVKLPEKESPVSAKSGGEASFKIRTFSAVVGVRGTDFYTSYDPNSGLTEQATIEGSVEVKQAGTDQKVLVNTGYQVAVEATAAAVASASASAKVDKDLEAPKQAPEVAAVVAPLKVRAIQDSLRSEMRGVSSIVRNDQDFGHAKAVETLGQPATWTLEREKVPDKLKDLKNEF